MFLDPEPIRPKHTMSSGFFSSQRPVHSPRDVHRTAVKRKPLHEQSPSRSNQKLPSDASFDPTVRLVKPSQSPPTTPSTPRKLQTDDNDHRKEQEFGIGDGLEKWDPSSTVAKQASPSKPEFVLANHDEPGPDVSDRLVPSNETDPATLPPSSTWLTSNPLPEPKPAWHRRSVSSGWVSDSSTLYTSKDINGSGFFGAPRSIDERSHSRFSQGTTLRGTPTPYEQEQQERTEVDTSMVAREAPVQTLDTLVETSPERATVRTVAPSLKSVPSERELRSQASQTSLSRLQSSPFGPDQSTHQLRRVTPRRRSSSASSILVPSRFPTVRQPTSPPSPATRGSSAQSEDSNFPLSSSPNIIAYGSSDENRNSGAFSDVSVPQTSSPNFIVYHSPGSRPRSRSHVLRSTTSFESISSRLQYPTIVRPDTGSSIADGSSPPSFQQFNSVDTLPPLHIPRRRPQWKIGTATLRSDSNGMDPSSSDVTIEEIDTQPFPRQVFSSHLSTIASESDRYSRTASQQLSHFSLGSGVWTVDDSSSIPLSERYTRPQSGSAPPVESVPSSSEPPAPATSSEASPGDMTLGVFREESAKPPPLFKRQWLESAPGSSNTRFYDGPMPPLPPIPPDRDSEERFDQVSELQFPGLRNMRSGQSLRRSNSTPSQSQSQSQSHSRQVSYSESDRWSTTSSVFPVWAKHFYAGGVALMSPSKVSLITATPIARPPGRMSHYGHRDSQYTDSTVPSRVGTSYDNDADSASPPSGIFSRAIWRPRTRPRRTNPEVSSHRSRFRRNKHSPNSGEQSSQRSSGRPDSMTIQPSPLPNPTGTVSNSREAEADLLPSGQPKYGPLKDAPEPGDNTIPRRQRAQQRTYPRAMTQASPPATGQPYAYPTLAPTRRSTGPQHQSAWRPPSFVESLDTLLHSRCNRQILLFVLGFACPLLWIVGAVLPVPPRPDISDGAGGEEFVVDGGEGPETTMAKLEVGIDPRTRWAKEHIWLKARWWRALNRVMSVVGIVVVGAVIALAIVATRK